MDKNGKIESKGSIRKRLEEREELLSPFAVRSARSRGREIDENPCPLRTEFQRDRDRIIHSKAFRRLKHKTQVFVMPQGDHYVTRLTHTLEVAQISRTIARGLNLNEDLTEAMSLGHDMGHTPFGHIGEDELNGLYSKGFSHNKQSLRIVETLEKGGKGLNLTHEVRQGIVSHSKKRGDFMSDNQVQGLTLEGQILRISDAVAYLNHDLADAFRASKLRNNSLPEKVNQVLGTYHSRRINSMVTDIISCSQHSMDKATLTGSGNPVIGMSDSVRDAMNILREHMFERVYIPEDLGEEGQTARRIIRLLFEYYNGSEGRMPEEYSKRSRNKEEGVIDYISGMTDHYAIRRAEKIRPGIGHVFHTRLL